MGLINPNTGLSYRYERLRSFLQDLSENEGVIASVLRGGRANVAGLARMAQKIKESIDAGPKGEEILSEVEIAAALHVFLCRRETRKVVSHMISSVYGVNRHAVMAELGGPSGARDSSVWREILNVVKEHGPGSGERAIFVGAEGER